MNADHLAVIGVVAYVLAYAGTFVGAEAAHISQLLASAPSDPSESQARVISDRTTTRCPHCRRPGIVRVGDSGVSAGISHRRWCPSHPRHAHRPRHAF